MISRLILDEKPELRTSSLATYLSAVKRAHVLMTGRLGMPKDIKWITIDNVKKLDHLSVNKKKGIYIPLLILTKSNDQLYDKLLERYKDIDEQYQSHQEKNLKTAKQQNGWKEHKEIAQLLKSKHYNAKALLRKPKWGKSDYKFLKFYLFLKLVVEMPPLRNDYPTLEVVTDENQTTGNYIKVKRKKWIIGMRSYKTSKKHGEVVIEVPKSVGTFLNKFTKRLKVFKDRVYLFQTYKGKPTNRNAFSKWVTRNFERELGTPIGITQLRRSYISDKFPVTTDNTVQKRKEIATAMLHTLNTQMTSYSKITS